MLQVLKTWLVARCAETVQPTELNYQVNVRGLLLLRFHHECYEAWVHFNPRRGFRPR